MSDAPAEIRLTEGQAAVRRLIALGAALLAMIIAGSAALLTAGSQALDALQSREDRTLVGSVLDRRLQRMVTDITTATVWNQAYRELRPGGNPQWLDEEIGSYLAGNRGHDLSMAIGRDGRPFYAWKGEARIDPNTQSQFLADVAPVIRRARAIETARGAKAPEAPPTAAVLSETASGFVLSGGVIYLVAASTVTPENAEIARDPGPSTLVVSAQRLDHEGIVDGVGIDGFKSDLSTVERIV